VPGGCVDQPQGNPADKSRRRGRGVRFNDVEDGAAATLMVGTLTSDTRIPWMKPEDVVAGDQPALPDDKGFFGAAGESVRGLDKAKGAYGLSARATGRPRPADDGRHFQSRWCDEGPALAGTALRAAASQPAVPSTDSALRLPATEASLGPQRGQQVGTVLQRKHGFEAHRHDRRGVLV